MTFNKLPEFFKYRNSLVVCLIAITLAGCAINRVHPDCQEIIDRDYVPVSYTCWHKSVDYSRCLNNHGEDAYVLIGCVDGHEGTHAWVEVRDVDVWWVDPTWDIGRWKKEKWTDRRAIVTGFQP